MGNLILGKEYFDVKGACLEVYNQLGCGFLELSMLKSKYFDHYF